MVLVLSNGFSCVWELLPLGSYILSLISKPYPDSLSHEPELHTRAMDLISMLGKHKDVLSVNENPHKRSSLLRKSFLI